MLTLLLGPGKVFQLQPVPQAQIPQADEAGGYARGNRDGFGFSSRLNGFKK